MGSLKVSRASNTVMSTRFWKAVGLMVAGYITSIVITGFARDNVVDIGVRGGDAIYGVGASFILLLLPIGRNNARSLALGSGFGAGLTLYQEMF